MLCAIVSAVLCTYVSTVKLAVVDSQIPKHMSQLFRIATSVEKDVNKTSFSIETTSIHCNGAGKKLLQS